VLQEIEENPSLLSRLVSKWHRLRTHFGFAGIDEEVVGPEENIGSRHKRSVTDDPESKFATDLSENMLTESLNRHKLRGVEHKVAKLNPTTDQITSEILRQFCPKA
jgi:hypothetical protein